MEKMESQPRKMTRRDLLKAGAGLMGASLLAACGPAATPTPKPAEPTATPKPAFDWKRFEGEHIEAVVEKGPRMDLLLGYLDEFHELTGITVGAEQIPFIDLTTKQVVEFTSGKTSFDMTSVLWHVQKQLFGKGKWLEDLRDLLNDPTMTAPDFDFEDFSPGAVAYGTQADGRIDTLPLIQDPWTVYWNKELFAAKGVEYPQTYDEMLEAAKAIHDPDNGIYGFVARGKKYANAPVWTDLLLGWDVDAVDSEGQLHTDGPEAIAAAELYTKLLKDYGPPGVAGFNWNECQTSFAQGTIGMWLDGIGFATPLEDPTTSQVVGKVGYGIHPAGPKAHHTGMFGTGLGVSAFSEKKEPAYFFVQWMVNKRNQARVLAAGTGSPARKSAYEDPEAKANLKVPQEWVDTLVASGPLGRAGLPVIVPVSEFRDILGAALTNMLEGADPATELKKATEQFRPVLEESLKG